jgi:hypothetical protein
MDMQETAGLDPTGRHCVLETTPECIGIRERVLASLLSSGVAAAPTLVFDLVAATCGGSIARAPASGRPSADAVASCMRDVQVAMRRVHGSPLTRPEVHLRAAEAFLASWFASAPRLDTERDSIRELELIAIGIRPNGASRALRWVEWRRREEQAMQGGGSPGFLRALAEIRSATAEGFAAIDERVWTIQPGELVPPRLLEVASSRKAGVEAERFRSHIGPFHEIGAYGLPPDPTRLVVTDLALLGTDMPEARALLAAKIADASLSVRFGSMPRPAARRPRVLLVAALEDDLAEHVLHPGKLIPSVDPLREALLHALPACLRVLSELQIDFELEIHRASPLSSGRLRISDLRARSGRLAVEYRTAPRMLARLARDAPWMFADAPSRRPSTQPPSTAGFDASYLLTAGSKSGFRESAAWLGSISIQPAGDASLRVAAYGSLPSTSSLLVPLCAPERAAAAAAAAFGGVPREEDPRNHASASIEGTTFS